TLRRWDSFLLVHLAASYSGAVILSKAHAIAIGQRFTKM
ncbi:MAG: hypothetical protein ACI9G5_002611, partial [Paracoccaceae bacterium]